MMHRFIRGITTGFTFAVFYIILDNLGASTRQYVAAFTCLFVFGLILGVSSYIDGYDSRDK